MNMEMWRFEAWQGKVGSQNSPTCHSERDVDISIHLACPVCLLLGCQMGQSLDAQPQRLK